MAGSCRLRFPHHMRPFWLLVALAVMLLITVSSGTARVGPADELLAGLERDLGALRVQIEAMVADPAAPAGQGIGSNADFASGDGGFGGRALATMLHSASRYARRLARALEDGGAADRTEIAILVSARLRDLAQTLDGLRPGVQEPAKTPAMAEALPAIDRLQKLVLALRAPAPPADAGADGGFEEPAVYGPPVLEGTWRAGS